MSLLGRKPKALRRCVLRVIKHYRTERTLAVVGLVDAKDKSVVHALDAIESGSGIATRFPMSRRAAHLVVFL